MHICSTRTCDTHGPRRALLAPARVLVIVSVTIRSVARLTLAGTAPAVIGA